MSVKAAISFNLGILRAVERAVRLTAPGHDVRCPICDRGLQYRVENGPTGIRASVWCERQQCFAITQEIHRPGAG